MHKTLAIAIYGFMLAIVATIVFVKAGQGGGESGGQQTAQILKAGGQAIGNVATALEGGQAA